MIELHILNKSARLDPFIEIVKKAFSEGLSKVQGILPVDDVDVIVADNPDWAIPETGVGGQAPTAHLVYININPLHDGLSKRLDSGIQSTLAHELHHCARMKAIGYGKTLWEVLITEGLTAHFDIEVIGGEPKPWDKALSSEQISELLNKAKRDFDNNKYNHIDWFFGRQELGIPRWTGYSVGFYLVSEYLKKHPGETAGKLYKTPASQFRVGI